MGLDWSWSSAGRDLPSLHKSLGLIPEFKASLVYMRPCLKKIKINKQVLGSWPQTGKLSLAWVGSSSVLLGFLFGWFW